MRGQNCRSPPHPRLLLRGQIICMNRRSFTHGANENMGVPGSQPPTERLAQSQQMLNLTQKPTSQMNLSLRCIGCLLWCLTGCTLFSAQEVIHLKEAVRLHETQDEVQRRLGRPHFTKPLPNGQMVWVYQVWTNTGEDLNGPRTRYCDLYRLLFDERAILRQWRHHSC